MYGARPLELAIVVPTDQLPPDRGWLYVGSGDEKAELLGVAARRARQGDLGLPKKPPRPVATPLPKSCQLVSASDREPAAPNMRAADNAAANSPRLRDDIMRVSSSSALLRVSNARKVPQRPISSRRVDAWWFSSRDVVGTAVCEWRDVLLEDGVLNRDREHPPPWRTRVMLRAVGL